MLLDPALAPRLARMPLVRLVVAGLFIALHVVAFSAMGRERFNLPLVAPTSAPSVAFSRPNLPLVGPQEPAGWQRMLVSRWDSQHYISFGLRGTELCPAQDLRRESLPPKLVYCGFNFYPGYPALGAIVSKLGLSIDTSLLLVTLLATLALFYAWTSETVCNVIGRRRTWLALFLFNVFTTGFAVVTVQTEAVTIACMFGAFVCLEHPPAALRGESKERIRTVVGLLLAGAASGFRVTGAAVGGAFICALAFRMWREGKSLGRIVTTAILAAPLALSGQLAIMAYYGVKYHDPLLYVHAHGQAYGHEASLLSTLFPSPERVLASMQYGLHEGIFVVAGFMFLALGHREALRRASGTAKVFFYVLAVLWLGVSLLGSSQLAFAGMNRYWLGVPLVFFSMAAVLERRPAALGLWIVVSLWHYWNVDLCVYMAEHSASTMCKLGHQP